MFVKPPLLPGQQRGYTGPQQPGAVTSAGDQGMYFYRITYRGLVGSTLLAALLATIGACGGGSSSSSSGNSPASNPVPAIAALSPQSVSSCGTGFTLTVHGSNFIAHSAVIWNGTARATTYVSPTELTVAINAGDVAVQGTAAVAVDNPLPGGGRSASTRFTAACATQVAVDANASQLAQINSDLFGTNLTASMDLTSSNSNYSTMMTAFQAAHFGLVRWPMALLSDYYHWQTNSFSSCTPMSPTARTTFDQFMQQVAQPLGVDVDITVNYGSNADCTAGGDPNEAAAWVDYANNQKHYGIRYWTIGNEQYFGSPVVGSSLSTPDFNVTTTETGAEQAMTYANLVATRFYPLMKAKDPSIQIGVDLVVPENAASDRAAAWDSTVLANAKYDFVEVHWYGASPPNSNLSDSSLLAAGDSYFGSALAALKSELAAAGKANTPIYAGEWGLPGQSGSPQDITVVGALYTALALGEMAEGGVAMGGTWEGFDSGPCNANTSSDYSLQTWYTPSMFEAIAGGTNPACPGDAQPPLGTAFPRANAVDVVEHAFNAGDAVIAPAVSTSLTSVKVFSTRRSTGYGILLVNLDQNNSVTTTIGIDADTRTFNASQLTYGKAQYDDSASGVWTAPVSQSLGNASGSIQVTLPPWSVTAITLTATP